MKIAIDSYFLNSAVKNIQNLCPDGKYEFGVFYFLCFTGSGFETAIQSLEVHKLPNFEFASFSLQYCVFLNGWRHSNYR